MSSHAAAAEKNDHHAVDGYPTYVVGHPEDAYIDGYDPVSLGASHSSLLKSSTWLGMGLFMASLAGFGTSLYGLAQFMWGGGTVEHNPMAFVIGGLVAGAIGLVISFVLMLSIGRKDYFAYRKRTGRYN